MHLLSVFDVAEIYRIKLLTRLPIGLSNLREHKFRHNFQDNLLIEPIPILFRAAAIPSF